MPERAWSGRSYGGGVGTALGCAVARWGGRDLCYLLVILPALWFWLRHRRARRAVATYWRALRPEQAGWIAQLRVPWHLWIFARGLADRVIDAVAPSSLQRRDAGMEYLVQGVAGGRGCIVLSAHIGSFELAARWLSHRPEPLPCINLVMLDAEDPRVQRHLTRAMGDRPYAVIDLRDPIAASLSIAGALGRGEICCMLGDRTAGSVEGTRSADFLGRPIRLPIGPFIAAAVTGAPIVATFCCRTGWATWSCEVDPPWQIELGSRAEREARLAVCVQRWADRLAEQVRRHPWAWNNYFDVWA